MVGLLVRLRITLWRNALRRSTARLVSTVLGVIAAFTVGLGLGIGLVALGWQPLPVASVAVPLLALITVLWLVLSVIASGVDSSLEARRFAVLPVRAEDLAQGLFAAALVGIPAAFLGMTALAWTIGWSVRGWPGVAAVPACLLGVPTAIVGSRVVTAWLAGTLGSRRGREMAALIVSLVTVVPMVLNLVVLTQVGRLRGLRLDATEAARVVGWTPLGWAWSLPFDVASGTWGALVVHLVLATALLTVLWRGWVRLLHRELTSPLTDSASVRVGPGRVLRKVLGTGVVGAIATRRIRAWRRDSRLLSLGLRSLVIPGFFLVQAAVLPSGRGTAGLALVMVAMMGGLTLVNDLAFDGPAWWMHVAAAVPGIRDRWARVLAAAVVFGPLVALIGALEVGFGLISHPVAWAAAVASVFPVSLGVGALVGAWTPGTAPPVGGNPFSASSGDAATGCATGIVGLVAPLVLSLPVLITAYVVRDSPAAALWAVAGSVVWGVGILWAAVTIGGRHLDREGPETLARITLAVHS